MVAKLLQRQESSLRQLDLALNSLGDREVEIIASSIVINTTLVDLDLDCQLNRDEYHSRGFRLGWE